jgi:hypothetical protein
MGNNSKKEQTRGKAVSQLTAILEVTNPELGKLSEDEAKLVGWGKMQGFQVRRKNG